jgi:hypothetical protein
VVPIEQEEEEEEEYMGNAFITNQYSHVLQNLGFSHW